MWHLTKLALRNRIVTIVIALAIAGVSIWAFTGLKVELLPDISFPYTTVVTIYPQAAPQDVADEVTEPIEKFIWDEWQNEGLKHVTSTSVSGMSIIMAEFEFGTDMDKVGDRLKEGVSRLELPQAVLAVSEMMGNGTENPQIIPINMNVMPLVSLSLSGDLSPEEIKLITEQQIVPELSKVDGVLRVDAEGVDQEQVLISPDPDEMTRYGISMAQIAGLIQTSNSSIDAVKNTVLDSSGTRLSDFSSVVLSPPLSSAIIRTNGKPSVGISLTKTEEANTVETAEAIQAKVAELQAELGDKVTIETIFDQSDFINASINQLWEKAVVGAILAVLVVFLFLRALRASLITAISIPLSVFIGFLCMRLTGITINLLTLSAITIAIGRLIDDSIVILEVIFRHLRQGESFKEAAINGAREVANPVTTATLATVAIFIPLIFVGGIVGEIFIPFALTVTFAMLASLLVALMLIPAMARLIGSSKNKITEIKDNWYQKVYVKALKWTLNHRVGVVVIAIVLLVVSVGLLPVTGTSFMSGAMGEPTINVSIALPPGTDIKTTDEITAEVENILKDTPAIKSYQSKIGTSSSLTGLMSTAQGGGSNTAAIVAYLNSEADVQQETAELTRRCAEIQTQRKHPLFRFGIRLGYGAVTASLSSRFRAVTRKSCGI
jgi:HAE1 family hydrophobic/amphiphilic exporter-1